MEQFPDGNTRHLIYGKANAGSEYELLHEFTGFTMAGEILEKLAENPWPDVHFLKVETVESPSWVSWSEIEILSDLPTSVESPELTPAIESFELSQNYPNPFNPSTTIMFKLQRPAHVKLAIYDLLGHRVARLVDGLLNAGSHSVVWNGRNDKGKQTGSGVYIYKVAVDGQSKTKKLLLVK